MAEDRHVPLQGASNMRDLGGLPLRNGGRVRRGRVFRSASLNGLTAADHDRLRALGLGTVVDLRSPSEQRDTPSNLPPGLAVIAPGDGGAGPQPGARRNRRPHTEAAAIEMMRQGYQTYPHRMAAATKALFQAVADADAGAILVHCAAGKDRTGFVAAMLLQTVGASAETVMQDYLATNLMWDRKSDRISFLPKPAKEAIFSTRTEYLQAALETLLGEFGSTEDYLAKMCGIDTATVSGVRAALIEAR